MVKVIICSGAPPEDTAGTTELLNSLRTTRMKEANDTNNNTNKALFFIYGDLDDSDGATTYL